MISEWGVPPFVPLTAGGGGVTPHSKIIVGDGKASYGIIEGGHTPFRNQSGRLKG